MARPLMTQSGHFKPFKKSYKGVAVACEFCVV